MTSNATETLHYREKHRKGDARDAKTNSIFVGAKAVMMSNELKLSTPATHLLNMICHHFLRSDIGDVHHNTPDWTILPFLTATSATFTKSFLPST